jgi:hypothetical protein
MGFKGNNKNLSTDGIEYNQPGFIRRKAGNFGFTCEVGLMGSSRVINSLWTGRT